MGIDAVILARFNCAVPDARIIALNERLQVFDVTALRCEFEYTEEIAGLMKRGAKFLEIVGLGRYCSPNHLRGNLPHLYAVCCVLEALTGAEIWYGGDDGNIQKWNHEEMREWMGEYGC